MTPSIRRLAWGLAIAIPAILLISFFVVRSISRELDDKFYQSIDSVPTRVYSGVYWLKKGTGASIEELRFRLKEREYKDVGSPDAVKASGTYALQSADNVRPATLTIFTNDFGYPQLSKEMIFGSAAANTDPARFVVQWVGGEVTQITNASGSEVAALALEPTLVAQLNQGSIQARRTVSLSQIPHTLMEGIVLTEDQRFLEHPGIDLRGIARSMYVNLRSGGYVQGASTITQQLARNVYLSRQKTITRKLKEMLMSVLLEFKFSKDQILEKYLNEVYFGQSGNIAVHGVSEAAKFYYDKNLDELTVAEQAMLAGIVRGPFYYSPFRHYDRAKGRQEIVLGKMAEAGVITKAQYKEAKNEKLNFARISLVSNRAPYFTDMVQAQLLKDLPEQEVLGAGFTIFSTLDTYYQSLAEKAVASGVGRLEDRLKQYLAKKSKPKKGDKVDPGAPPMEHEVRLLQGVFVAVDPTNGHLLALVGGRSYEESTYNRALLMRRQIGSTIKPFVYLTALMHLRNPDGTPVNAISKFEDKPFTYEFDGKAWSPSNYEKDFSGTVTMRYALANSINTVAAQVAIQTGLDKVVDVVKAAGVETPIKPLPSLALGAIELPPLEVATAYTTLANFGLRREITSTLAVVGEDGRGVARYQPREDRALPPEETSNIVNLMTSVIETGSARGARAAGFFWPAAGKTGTTNEYRDAWFSGFTRKLVGISWVGFDRDDEVVRKNRQALKLTGASAALPVWTDFMIAAHKNQEFQPIAYPDGMLRTLQVDLITGKRANYRCMGESVQEETFTYKNVPIGECN